MCDLKVLGNSSSPHLRTWLRVLPYRFNLRVYDIHTGRPSILENLRVPVVVPLPGVFRHVGKLFQYIFLGLWLRWFCRRDGLIHAHNASGYGLSALLSGQAYIITTYGSEVYGARRRGVIYRWILKKILSNARLVTTSSDHMRRTLVRCYRLPPGRIFSKMLLDPRFLDSFAIDSRGQERTWFVNRRMTELYCTISVVQAFKVFVDEGGVGRLVLLEGDADRDYAARVRAEAEDCSNIEIIRGFVDQKKLIEQLNRAHFAISVPKTDQFSSSILEAAACGAIPVLRNLESYERIKGVSIILNDSLDFESSLISMFKETSALPYSDVEALSADARSFVSAKFSHTDFLESYADHIDEIA